MTQPIRRKLPDERKALTHKFDIQGHEGYITVGLFEDGQPGEIFLVMAKEGSTISGFADAFAQAISYALQYGVPLQALVDKFSHVRFEPSGMTRNPEIRFAKSIVDYIFRWMASKFLSAEAQFHAGVNGRELDEADGGVRDQRRRRRGGIRRRRSQAPRVAIAVLDHPESGRRAAVLDLRRDHDPQRRLLQVHELRQHQRLRVVGQNWGPSGGGATARRWQRLIAALALLVATTAPAGAAQFSDQEHDELPGFRRAVATRARTLPDPARAAAGLELRPLAGQPRTAPGPKTTRELYVSWGYNADLFKRADLHLAQPSLGNDFVLHGVQSHDQKGWTDLFNNSLTTSQSSARIGYFFNAKQDLALELNFEHVRFLVTQDQTVRMTGTLNSAPVDQTVTLTEDFLRYKLNNGANFLLVNVVKRLPLVGEPGKRGSIAVLLKAGAGFGFPHPTNSVFGQENTPGFQFGGLDLGVEGAVRFHLLGLLYLEFAQKGIYAHYSGLKIHDGRAAHDIWTYLTALSLGTSLRF